MKGEYQDMLGLEGRKTVTRSPTALGGKTQAKPRWKNSPELGKEELKLGPQVRVSKRKALLFLYL